jgi:enediyne biosynthesis protein E4
VKVIPTALGAQRHAMLLLAVLGSLGCTSHPDQQPQPLLRLASDAGLAFVHVTGAQGARELPETMGAGAALFDADVDGDVDVYLVQSGPLRRATGTEDRAAAANQLFLNDGQARFREAPGALGAADQGYGQGVAVGDADGDGRDDLWLLNWGPNALYLNRPGGFEQVEAGPAADQWSVAGVFVDIDGDGDLDFYEVNYLKSPPDSYLDPLINPEAPAPYRHYAHPDQFKPERDRLLINVGQGRYELAPDSWGLTHAAQKGLGVVSLDIELDGWRDLYVTNDSTPNMLLWNQSGRALKECGREAGCAFNDDGETEAGMGVDTADVDLDGDFDLFCTNLDQESNTLYLNASRAGEAPRFRDRTRASGLVEPSLPWVGFGALFEDLDGDGDRDLLVVNGHIIDNVQAVSESRRYPQANQVFLGDGKGVFSQLPLVGAAAAFAEPTVSRGLYCADLNGDGALDFLETINGGAPRLFLGSQVADLCVRANGGAHNPRGLGASFTVELSDGRRLLGQIESTRSYAGACEPVWCTGLPAPAVAIEVLWPGGQRERFTAGPLRGALLLERGQGQALAE